MLPGIWRDLFQYNADWPRRDGNHARRRDEAAWRQYLGRRQHVLTQRHRAVLSLWPLGKPGTQDLQAVARSGAHRRIRLAPRDVRIHAQVRIRPQDVGGESLLDQPNLLGAKH